jgi:hypothetical protein
MIQSNFNNFFYNKYGMLDWITNRLKQELYHINRYNDLGELKFRKE